MKATRRAGIYTAAGVLAAVLVLLCGCLWAKAGEAAPAEYSLQSVAIGGGKGSAVVSAPEDCTLITGFYEEKGGKALAFRPTQVKGGTEGEIPILLPDPVPEAGYVRLFLLESGTSRPLCESLGTDDFGELQSFAADQPYHLEWESDPVLFTVEAAHPDATEAVTLCREDGTEAGVMRDDGENGDRTAGDGVYSCQIDAPGLAAGESRTYQAVLGQEKSKPETLRFFAPLTGETAEAAAAEQEQVDEDLKQIEARFDLGPEGVDPLVAPALLDAVEAYFHRLEQKGAVCVIDRDEKSIYVKFTSGIGMIYEAAPPDTSAGGGDAHLTIFSIQPDSQLYWEVLEEISQQIGENLLPVTYSPDLSRREEHVTPETLNSLSSNQVVIWNGHGLYHRKTGCGLVTGMKPTKQEMEAYNGGFAHDLILLADTTEEKGLATVTPKYVETYCGDLSNDFIILAACDSMRDDKLAQAFSDKGADAVFGFTDSVLTKYALLFVGKMLEVMQEVNPLTVNYYTLEEALGSAEYILGSSDYWFHEEYLNQEQREKLTYHPTLPGAAPYIYCGKDYRLAELNCDFIVTGGEYGKDYVFEYPTLKLLTDTPMTVRNRNPKTPTGQTIYVDSYSGISLTLAGVNIDVGGRSQLAALELRGMGVSQIILKKGTENILISGSECAGLQKDSSAELRIIGEGSLRAEGGVYAAGIGGGKGVSLENTEIFSGTIIASGGMGGAGIGGGWSGGCASVKIHGGTVTASGKDGGAGVGGGEKGRCEGVSISGGDVTAYGDEGAGIGGGFKGEGCDIRISGGKVNASGNAGIGGGCRADGHGIEISDGTVIANGKDGGAAIGGGNADGKKGCGYDITISGGKVTAETYSGGAGIGSGSGGNYAEAKGYDITVSGGTVNITVTGSGNGSGGGAGIGGGYDSPGENLTVSGGDITIRAHDGGAGIGGGESDLGHGKGLDITISGGTLDITANGGGAGIGGGLDSSGENITISGASVTASAEKGAAGIGGGGMYYVKGGSAKNIHIFDCIYLSAHCLDGNGADIGAGENADSENVVVESPNQ